MSREPAGGADRALASATAVRRGAPERTAAWLLTGPVGHLVAGVTDLAALVWALLRARVRARLR